MESKNNIITFIEGEKLKINVENFDFTSIDGVLEWEKQFIHNGNLHLQQVINEQYKAGIIDENGNRIRKEGAK